MTGRLTAAGLPGNDPAVDVAEAHIWGIALADQVIACRRNRDGNNDYGTFRTVTTAATLFSRGQPTRIVWL